MKEITKTLVFTIALCLIAMVIIALVQARAERSIVDSKCSYLDPPIIDLLAFSAALFLVIEGLYRIFQHKKENWTKQLTRSFRILFGCTILILHIMQFLHK